MINARSTQITERSSNDGDFILSFTTTLKPPFSPEPYRHDHNGGGE
jgi:hypothetical protein